MKAFRIYFLGISGETPDPTLVTLEDFKNQHTLTNCMGLDNLVQYARLYVASVDGSLDDDTPYEKLTMGTFYGPESLHDTDETVDLLNVLRLAPSCQDGGSDKDIAISYVELEYDSSEVGLETYILD